MANQNDKRAINDLMREMQEKYGGNKDSNQVGYIDNNENDTMEVEVSIYKNGLLQETTKGEAICSAILSDDSESVEVVVGGCMSPVDLLNMLSVLIYSIEQDVLPQIGDCDCDDCRGDQH